MPLLLCCLLTVDGVWDHKSSVRSERIYSRSGKCRRQWQSTQDKVTATTSADTSSTHVSLALKPISVINYNVLILVLCLPMGFDFTIIFTSLLTISLTAFRH